MAKKKKHEEHENLERWLVAYADIMTLLFATFVVLYALAQTDVSELAKIDEALQRAFSRNAILQGQDSLMDGSQNIFDSQNGNSFIQELMTEYISPKYESKSFDEIEKSIQEMDKKGELEGVKAEVTDFGLLITFEEKSLFASGSAELSADAKKLIDKIGVLIYEKFVMHCIRIEGHTDSAPISSAKYPSNWELSSARSCSIIRYMIERFKFSPSLFTAVGYADTRRADNGKAAPTSAKNRRVEVLVLKNRYNALERPSNDVVKLNREQQIEMQIHRKQVVSEIKHQNNISQAAKSLMQNEDSKVIDMRDYAKSKGIILENKELYNKIETVNPEKKQQPIEEQLPRIEDIEQ